MSSRSAQLKARRASGRAIKVLLYSSWTGQQGSDLGDTRLRQKYPRSNVQLLVALSHTTIGCLKHVLLSNPLSAIALF